MGKENLQVLSYSELVKSLDGHYKSKIHVIKARYEFYNRKKRESKRISNGWQS